MPHRWKKRADHPELFAHDHYIFGNRYVVLIYIYLLDYADLGPLDEDITRPEEPERPECDEAAVLGAGIVHGSGLAQ